ncbi:MAG TPA: EthD family reductase [Candidatus Binataceae bacterium]|nr:EthD family reductase [Candidatus Binataceae bacterium]
MVKFCVIYEGRPEDCEKFDRHYWEKHLPIVARWPGLRRLTLNKARQLNEGIYMIAEMYFDDLNGLETALASPERREAGQDRLRFPNFYGTIRYQVLEIRDYPIRT